MGACSSCLGRNGYQSDDPETSRLLYEDPYHDQYGSQLHNAQRSDQQADSESLRQERKALEGICLSMSNNIIDVFTTVPQYSMGGDESASPQSAQPRTDRQLSATDSKRPKNMMIKRGHAGPMISQIGEDTKRFEAVKDAIG